jgi:hypothetical protein
MSLEAMHNAVLGVLQMAGGCDAEAVGERVLSRAVGAEKEFAKRIENSKFGP